MFFGRKDERRKIVAMEGEMTHLVYGGRRLGKTALLATIAREYRVRAPDELVLFLDLKGTGTGSQKPTDEFLAIDGRANSQNTRSFRPEPFVPTR